MHNSVIKINWPAPKHVHAYVTTRHGGVSTAPFDSFNLALHVNDDPQAVKQNREILRELINLPNEPHWLHQTHSNHVHIINQDNYHSHNPIEADAAVTQLPQQTCVILTADCLPILFCNKQGNEVAAVHAGWRGLANNIIANTLNNMQSNAADLMAWIGPAISNDIYTVGQEVFDTFTNNKPATIDCFQANTKQNNFQCDLAAIAKLHCQQLGINSVFGGTDCTYKQNKDFYSYRANSQTGRIASLIWFDSRR